MDKTSDFNDIINKNLNSDLDESNLLNDDEFFEVDEGRDTMDEEDQADGDSETTDEKEEQKEDEKQSESNSSDHDGKYFVVQKGLACCDKGAKFPQFKVTSQQKHYWNDEQGQTDYLAVTEDDLTFNPAAMPFGTCSIKNGNPCAFAPSGKWTKTYDKVKILDKKCVTELSELLCAVGGKITVMKPGQQSEAGKSNVNNADSAEQQTYNPMMDFEEFKDEINQSDQLYYK
ncbi:DUF4280 domain-containing protein [Epilithonimonas zeae]|uniref:DUF4280 domain-containing protein n=1 Tax=Epilithonimonas zeae TaxID=1416779 RepID=UPI00200C775C|nr:DUF4280 domain-containing protein [Epilithonimonas zeae]